MIRRGRTPDRQRGSMAVEFVIVVPAFLLLLLLVAAGGDWVSASGQIGGAASDAARAASLARNWQDAKSVALRAATEDLQGTCANGGPQTTPVALPATAGFGNATGIQVTVTCTVDLSAIARLGIPAAATFSRTAVAPLDQFVQRS
jgi:Flp pilus assembly protein TadG